jgi:hypothetical protein
MFHQAGKGVFEKAEEELEAMFVRKRRYAA